MNIRKPKALLSENVNEVSEFIQYIIQEKNKIKLTDIILNGFFTMLFVLLIYLLAERIDIVPTLRFYSDNILILGQESDITIAESVIALTIIFEISWIISNLIYWRLIRNKKIIF